MKQRFSQTNDPTYWYITDLFMTASEQDIEGEDDTRRFEIGNYFATQAEAQANATEIKNLFKNN